MARTAQSEITLVDLNDGTNPIVGYLTNENHTFAASSSGVVSNVAGFTSSLVVYVGATLGTYVISADFDAANEYTITATAYIGTSTGWGTPSVTNAGAISVPSITNSAVSSVLLRVTFSVRDAANVVTTGLTRDISLSIVKEGTGGAVVDLTATGQIFTSNSAGAFIGTNADIILTLSTQGNIGNLTFDVSLNGGDFTTRTTVADTVQNIKGFSTALSGAFTLTGAIDVTNTQRLLISTNNLGAANDSITIKVTGATGGVDFVSIFKAKEGVTGAAAIIVNISSSSGNIFKNGLGAAKVLTVDVFDAADGTAITSGVTYSWTRANDAVVRIDSVATRLVQASGGVAATNLTNNTITVGPEDVTTLEAFNCTVSAPD